MKFPFHVTLLTLILTLVVLTGTSVGVTYYLNTHHTVEVLSQQVLGHAEKRIDERVNHLLFTAMEQCDLNRVQLEEQQPDPKDLPRFAAYWVKVMERNPRFASLGFTLDATGDGWYVRRRPDDSLVVIEIHRDERGRFQARDYEASHYQAGKGTPFRRETLGFDPRKGQWYVPAKKAGKQVWTETYVLPNRRAEPDRPGLTCATPVASPGGAPRGVLSITFELSELCRFLDDLEIGEGCIPFVVEYKADHPSSVIAHPNPAILLEAVPGSPGSSRLVPAESISDPVVRSFLGELGRRHPDLVPSELKDKTEAELQSLARIRFTHGGVTYRGTYRCLSKEETPDWLICIVVPESSILGPIQQSNRQTVLLLLVIGGAAVLLSLLAARWVARPLRRLAQQTESIGQFHLAAEPIHHSVVKEVDRLAVSMEDMKTSLRSFRKYVPTDVVRALLAAGQDASLGGEHRTVTIYFSDVANFTSISEQLTPEQIVTQLGEYFGGQSDQILAASAGTVDKYIGDSIMAFWGAPAANPRHAQAGCTAAVRNQQLLRVLGEKWKAEGKPVFATRIGLHTGEVIAGNIGSEARLNYTVMGDAVNLASRLEGLNKYYGTEILISESTYLEAKDGVVARPLDWVSVKGKVRGVLVYELLGLTGEVSKTTEELVAAYALALTSYRGQDWARAIELFEQVLVIQPQDQPARQMIERCRDYQVTPPPRGWDGVHHMAAK
jgi:adenylate cyclase